MQRILLIRLYHLGDVLLTTPALRRLRHAYPDARIDYLTRAGGAQVLEGSPYLDEVIVYPAEASVRAEWSLLASLRARRYDAVVDFLSTARTARAVWASGARLRVGVRGRGPRNLLYTTLVPRDEAPPLYAAERMVRMLAPLGVDTTGDELALDLAIGARERAWAAQQLEELGAHDAHAPLVALSAVSRDPCKQWGAERWAAVADALVATGARVLLTYGPGEAEQAARVAGAMRSRALLAPACTRISQLGALLEHATLWLGNDGGAWHMAVAAGVPTLALARHEHGAPWTAPVPTGRHHCIEGLRDTGGEVCRGGLDTITTEAVVGRALCLLDTFAAERA